MANRGVFIRALPRIDLDGDVPNSKLFHEAMMNGRNQCRWIFSGLAACVKRDEHLLVGQAPSVNVVHIRKCRDGCKKVIFYRAFIEVRRGALQ